MSHCRTVGQSTFSTANPHQNRRKMYKRPSNRVSSEISILNTGRNSASRRPSIMEAFEQDLRPRRESTQPLTNSKTVAQQQGPSSKKRRQELSSRGQSESLDIKQNAKDPVRIFAERVTIAGLYEAYKSTRKEDRIMFRLALLISLCMIGFESHMIIRQYLMQAPVISEEFKDHVRAPFPNVSFCYPGQGLNRTMLRAWMTDLSNVTLRRMEQYSKYGHNNYTVDKFMDELDAVLSWGVYGWAIGQPIYELTRVAFREAAVNARLEGRDVWEVLFPQCPDVVTDCSLDGLAIDCCQFVVDQPMLYNPCYTVVPGRLHQNRTLHPTELQFDKLGLSFVINRKASIITYSYEGDTKDGFHVFIGDSPSIFVVPTPIPAGMDAIIHLSEPTLVREMSDCIPDIAIPKLKYYPYYDGKGTHCIHELLLDLQQKYVDCILPIGTYSDRNKTCGFEQLFLINLLLDGGGGDARISEPTVGNAATVAGGNASKVQENKESQKVENSFDSDLILVSETLHGENSPCKPLCSRWTYPVFSSSYSSIQYRTAELQREDFEAGSWSRIRVVMPSASKTRFEEKSRPAQYLALCDIGGTMGVYAGFSMVTAVQVIAYGMYIVWYKMRNRGRVSADGQ